jgi:hypothetical protein
LDAPSKGKYSIIHMFFWAYIFPDSKYSILSFSIVKEEVTPFYFKVNKVLMRVLYFVSAMMRLFFVPCLLIIKLK